MHGRIINKVSNSRQTLSQKILFVTFNALGYVDNFKKSKWPIKMLQYGDAGAMVRQRGRMGMQGNSTPKASEVSRKLGGVQGSSITEKFGAMPSRLA